MANQGDSPLTVLFEATETQPQREMTSNESWFIDTSWLVSTDGFEVVVFPGENQQYKAIDYDLRAVELSLGGQQQLIGRVDVTRVGDRGSAVTCRGRDALSTIVESNVDPLFRLTDEMRLSDALLSLLSPCGITQILDVDADAKVRDLRTGKPTSGGKKRKKRGADPLRQYQSKPGEGTYEYVNRLLARLGLTLQPGPTRNSVCLARPQYEQDPLYAIQRLRGDKESAGNNVMRGVAERDYTRVPSHVLLSGTAATSGKKGEPISQQYEMYTFAGIEMKGVNGVSSPEIADVIGENMYTGRLKPGESSKQLYRLFYFRDEEARTQEQLDCAAVRAISERLKDTLSYQVTLRGHRDPATGAIWSVDTMVNVLDEVAGVNEPLWIAKRTLRYDRSSGATTDLECWRPGSFPFFQDT